MNELQQKEVDKVFNEFTDVLDEMGVTYALLIDKDDTFDMSVQGDAVTICDMIINGIRSCIDETKEEHVKEIVAENYIIALTRFSSELSKKHFGIDPKKYMEELVNTVKKGAN